MSRVLNEASWQRSRPLYATAILLVIALGLFWRSNVLPLSGFTAKYGGDALWALDVFLGFGFLFRSLRTRWIALLAVCFAWSIEFSQLYQAPWIQTLRATVPGRLVLGSSFNSPDLLAYAMGIALGVAGEVAFRRKSSRSSSAK